MHGATVLGIFVSTEKGFGKEFGRVPYSLFLKH